MHSQGVQASGVFSVCVRTCAACGSLFDKVSQLTVADEGALGVLAVAVEADVWVQVTLVHIWADTGTTLTLL